MNKAHVFQHQFTGVQIFVYHKPDQYHAKLELFSIVDNHRDWIYLGKKITTDVNTEEQ